MDVVLVVEMGVIGLDVVDLESQSGAGAMFTAATLGASVS
jgi:hypothetical protein